MTLVFTLLVVAIVLIGGFTVIIKGVNGGVSYSVEFVKLANKPFALSEVLSRVQMGERNDRPLLEQAVESAATSLEGARATGMIGDVRALMKTYDVNNYAISIQGVMRIDSAGERCGVQAAGWCTQSCDVGYVEINATGACTIRQVCCKLDVTEYGKTNKKGTVVECGGNGICSVGIMKTLVADAETLITYDIGPYCTDGQAEIQTNACKDTNAGKTPICCAPKAEKLMNTFSKASVPLIFKGKLNYMDIEVGAND